MFGHTFSKHGAGPKMTRNIRGEAMGTRDQRGQWLDNNAAAQFLANERNYLGDGERRVIDIPSGIGQVIRADGTIVPASRAFVWTKPGGYNTAFPVE